MNTLQYAGLTMGAIALAASMLTNGSPIDAHRAMAASVPTAPYSFTSISNPDDTTFTQLLGINKSGLIAGYYGSGADAQHPNKGFVLNLPSSFTPENYPNSAQTQVIGINDRGDTDGFYVDSAGATHGFTDIGGSFTSVDVPGTTFNQLLGLNNRGEQAGYYAFGPADAQTFVPFIRHTDGSILLLPIANAQATSITDQDLVGGFSNDSGGNSHGFLWQSGRPTITVDVPGAVSTQILGLNKLGQAVGSYTDAQKATHGFVYDVNARTFVRLDVPGSTSTVVNGINQRGVLVGFYADAANNVIGFVGTASSGMTNPGATGTPTIVPTNTPTVSPTSVPTGTPMTTTKFATSTTLSVSSTITQTRIPVTFTATLNPTQATGTVLLLDSGQPIAIGQLRNGAVLFRSVQLAGGQHQLTARYLGDATFQPSISSPVNVKVNQSF